jgi:hypothetical protein
MKRKMDKGGVEWCKANKPMIIQKLEQQKKLLPAPLRLLPRVALRAGAELLLDKAIANAESRVSEQSDIQ